MQPDIAAASAHSDSADLRENAGSVREASMPFTGYLIEAEETQLHQPENPMTGGKYDEGEHQ
jgi:hypothetical protein